MASAGRVINDLCKEEGMPTTRKSLQERGKKLLREEGPEGLNKRLLESLGSAQKVVIEGVRSVDAVWKLRDQFPGLRLLFVEATEQTRRVRLKTNLGVSDKEFDEWMNEPLEIEIIQLRSVAERIISNDNSFDDLHRALCEDICRSFMRKSP